MDGKGSGWGRTVWRGDHSEDTYEGTRRAGKAHGQGTLIYVDGNRYIGQWHDDMWHGRGAYTEVDGKTWICEWRNFEYVEGTCTLQ